MRTTLPTVYEVPAEVSVTGAAETSNPVRAAPCNGERGAARCCISGLAMMLPTLCSCAARSLGSRVALPGERVADVQRLLVDEVGARLVHLVLPGREEVRGARGHGDDQQDDPLAPPEHVEVVAQGEALRLWLAVVTLPLLRLPTAVAGCRQGDFPSSNCCRRSSRALAHEPQDTNIRQRVQSAQLNESALDGWFGPCVHSRPVADWCLRQRGCGCGSCASAGHRHAPETIERLVEGFDPLRIIVFGSHAVGMTKALQGLRAAIDVVPTDPEEIARRGETPGDVLRSALREGRAVYERDDSRSAGAAKAVKAGVVVLDLEPPRTHNLGLSWTCCPATGQSVVARMGCSVAPGYTLTDPRTCPDRPRSCGPPLVRGRTWTLSAAADRALFGLAARSPRAPLRPGRAGSWAPLMPVPAAGLPMLCVLHPATRHCPRRAGRPPPLERPEESAPAAPVAARTTVRPGGGSGPAPRGVLRRAALRTAAEPRSRCRSSCSDLQGRDTGLLRGSCEPPVQSQERSPLHKCRLQHV